MPSEDRAGMGLKRARADDFRATFPRDIGSKLGFPGCRRADDKKRVLH
jgi:hypothetical protein